MRHAQGERESPSLCALYGTKRRLYCSCVFPLVSCCLQMGLEDLPAEASESALEDEEFLKKFHHALLEVSAPQQYASAPAFSSRKSRSSAWWSFFQQCV